MATGFASIPDFSLIFSSLEAEINSPAEQAQNENRSKNAITVISAFFIDVPLTFILYRKTGSIASKFALIFFQPLS